MKTAGYSGTSLAKKLGIKNGYSIKLINQPAYYYALFTDFPPETILQDNPESKKDFIHYFAESSQMLQNDMYQLRQELKQNGMLWISWSKKASKVKTDLNGNIVRKIGLDSGLVDIKVCAVDETWSGLKFVIPVKDRI